MTSEEEARAWIDARWGGAAVDRLERFADLLIAENARQNLISGPSVTQLWQRHIVDSAQLLLLSEQTSGLWIDVGTGGGFPGVVVAALREQALIMAEPRRRRAEFLERACEALELRHARIANARVEQLNEPAAVVSARAVAAPARFLQLAVGVSTADTLFLLPSGRTTEIALVEAQRQWKGVFHVEQSVTSLASKIIVARNVRPI